MKKFNFFRTLLSFKYSFIFFIVFSIIFLLAQKYKISKIYEMSVFDLVTDLTGQAGSSNMAILVFLITPFVTFSILNYIDKQERYNKLLKMGSRKKVWTSNVISILYFSLLLTIIIVLGGYLFSGIILGSFENSWVSEKGAFYELLEKEDKNNFDYYVVNLGTLKIISILFLTKFLGLSVLGILVAIMKTLLKNNFLVVIVILLLSYIDGYFLQYSLLMQKMVINVNNWKNFLSIFINQIYLLILIFSFYFWGREIYSKKDFL
ncbi:hypothetical protein [Bacillus wiedmannii]|uniref:hypothetical protein n=1 Tax=Bacillus wiedmannii TaxID=1890302 RepID=UPI000BEF6C9F|nr:hypothetical protein [Bacillus wiedmannii]PEI67984.1 hypothetical protein CN905_27965 [Bacillus wiedmannii]PFZ59572.1 hypothetical protein COL76_22905 [Bacillus wiedmannii]PHB64262.1 hypothetical protein COE87_07530 [Bacillus wiedmannii]PHE04588.1 hypothetical protein COF56_12135 [Bacillus wiedmannii]PHG63697.1 hypothetical protein COI55_22120 [Bacillus wiedmannii]